MEILSPTEEGIARAARALAEGLLVAIPTETVYGLGANAFDTRAVARVFEAKRRPTFDPLIVHIAELDGLDEIASFPNDLARRLAEAFWPGPLTLILPKRERVPGLVTSGLDSVAVRMPAHPVARSIIRLSRVPVAAPSANPFGYLSPTRAEHVARMLGDAVDFIVDGGASDIGVESTVLDVTGERPKILRPGGLPRAAIEEICGPVDIIDRVSAQPTSPGQLESHYAPHARLDLVEAGGLAAAPIGAEDAVLFFDEASRRAFHAAREGNLAMAARGEAQSRMERVLSPSGDLREAAAALFDLLHAFDLEGVERVWAERLPSEGLGLAVNDRLWKASTKN
ncbi:MAG TPA: L-threonylcarbamoyladenylate synthase [Rectinemataceae bacterium]|nr:L-threonylcarbamoyladenylate synthase [Rectinemataceae bacterium]